MKVLVTGANGLLATNVIHILLERNIEVIGFLRNKNSFALPNHKNLSLCTGDITKPASYIELLYDIDCIIHVAALTSQNILDYNTYKKVNTDATEVLFSYANKHKVSRFIYVSTANCFGFGSLKDLGSEKKPIAYPFSKSLYAKSKLEGQVKISQLAASSKHTELVVLNPTFMIGAYDTKPSSGRLLLSAYNKKIIFYPPGGKSFINVQDAAEAVVNAITYGKHLNCYILSGENLSYLDFYKKVTQQLKQSSFYIKIPKFLLLILGYIGNILRFIGIKTDVSSINVRTLCVHNFYTNAKAVTELKLTPNPIDKGIADAIKWFNLT